LILTCSSRRKEALIKSGKRESEKAETKRALLPRLSYEKRALLFLERQSKTGRTGETVAGMSSVAFAANRSNGGWQSVSSGGRCG
jgi:hypothetical protein